MKFWLCLLTSRSHLQPWRLLPVSQWLSASAPQSAPNPPLGVGCDDWDQPGHSPAIIISVMINNHSTVNPLMYPSIWERLKDILQSYEIKRATSILEKKRKINKFKNSWSSIITLVQYVKHTSIPITQSIYHILSCLISFHGTVYILFNNLFSYQIKYQQCYE